MIKVSPVTMTDNPFVKVEDKSTRRNPMLIPNKDHCFVISHPILLAF